MREIRDLLFNTDQMYPMIDETAAIINTPADGLSMVDADRALWDFNPILASRYVSDDRAVTGKYYEIFARSCLYRHGAAAQGLCCPP